MCEQCCNKKGFFSGLLGGAAVTGGLFFLFGTTEGKKVQKVLKKKGGEAAHELKSLAKDWEKKSKELKDKAGEFAGEIKDHVEEKIKLVEDKFPKRK